MTAGLIAEEPGRLQTYAIEVDVIEKLKRIYYFAKRIAKAIVPPECRVPLSMGLASHAFWASRTHGPHKILYKYFTLTAHVVPRLVPFRVSPFSPTARPLSVVYNGLPFPRCRDSPSHLPWDAGPK